MPNIGELMQMARDKKRARQDATGGSWQRAIDKGYSERGMANRLIDSQDFLGQDYETSGVQGLQDFDPGAAFKEYTEGATRGAKGYLGEELEKLAGTSSAQGRLNTGFYDQDQGELVRNVYGDLNNTIAGAALQTAGMEQSRRGQLLDYGADRTNRYLDLVSGNNDRLTAKRNAEAAKKKKGGILGGLVGGAIGFATGGPAGAAAGALRGYAG